jgi:hypothetical protein
VALPRSRRRDIGTADFDRCRPNPADAAYTSAGGAANVRQADMSNHLTLTAIQIAIELNDTAIAIIIAFLAGLTRHQPRRER